jgi:phospholipid/cholesterol/gamma-HCH transport system substrate-binding protein
VELPRVATRARIAALAALAIAVVVVVVLLLMRSSYHVDAVFTNASQLVKGDRVTVAGEPIGTVHDISLTANGRAMVRMDIDGKYAPLRRGTRAIVRQASLSGEANRHIELELAPNGAPDIPSGGVLPASSTTSSVELDQLFDTFDQPTREGAQRTVRLLRDSQRGRERQAGEALSYLDPALASSSRLFGELDRSTPDFERFISQSAHLMTDTASRSDALSGLVGHLATTMDTLANRRDELGDTASTLPQFLRRANTTFVNLRATLDDLQPVVDEARPVVHKDLRPLLRQVRPFAADAQPTVRDLSRTIRSSGADNDLVELLRLQPAVDAEANRTATRDGAQRPGAFPASQKALQGATPQLGFLRPYTVDLVGWFDDFSTSGAYDAVGSFSRAGLQLNGFTFGAAGQLLPVPPELRGAAFSAGVSAGRNNRCPGSDERPAADGSNPYVPQGFDCDPSQKPIGP